jgi:hypothetical protein
MNRSWNIGLAARGGRPVEYDWLGAHLHADLLRPVMTVNLSHRALPIKVYVRILPLPGLLLVCRGGVQRHSPPCAPELPALLLLALKTYPSSRQKSAQPAGARFNEFRNHNRSRTYPRSRKEYTDESPSRVCRSRYGGRLLQFPSGECATTQVVRDWWRYNQLRLQHPPPVHGVDQWNRWLLHTQSQPSPAVAVTRSAFSFAGVARRGYRRSSYCAEADRNAPDHILRHEHPSCTHPQSAAGREA